MAPYLNGRTILDGDEALAVLSMIGRMAIDIDDLMENQGAMAEKCRDDGEMIARLNELCERADRIMADSDRLLRDQEADLSAAFAGWEATIKELATEENAEVIARARQRLDALCKRQERRTIGANSPIPTDLGPVIGVTVEASDDFPDAEFEEASARIQEAAAAILKEIRERRAKKDD